MKEYKRLTVRLSNGKIGCLQEYSRDDLIERLAELEDKIENGTLVFREKPKKKYYAIVGYRKYYNKFDWHIEYCSIEYEKEHNQVAVWANGLLLVTKKDLLFDTQVEAKAKLLELKGGQNGR